MAASTLDSSILGSSLLALPMIDTHTHFDMPVFADNRESLAQQAWQNGVQHLVLVGYVQRHFMRMQKTMMTLSAAVKNNPALHIPQLHLAAGLHPAYIAEHKEADLSLLAEFVKTHQPIAIGEIGMDTYRDDLKTDAAVKKQQQFFIQQLDLAVQHELPVLLHIRKAHAQCLKILKEHAYDAHQLGGIAHSFSGGEQEAKAFVKLGFRLGVTGQVTNPNAKKLRRALQAAVAEYGIGCLVIETDCPDMLPHVCHTMQEQQVSLSPQLGYNYRAFYKMSLSKSVNLFDSINLPKNTNVPANLFYVLATLSELFAVAPDELAQQLWQNSCQALQMNWQYPT